jgi:hypothetical protein
MVVFARFGGWGVSTHLFIISITLLPLLSEEFFPMEHSTTGRENSATAFRKIRNSTLG